MKTKQVIVVRKDLRMRKGKLIAQACHSSLKVFLDRNVPHTERIYRQDSLVIKLTDEMFEWVNGIFTKICAYVESEQELLEIVEKAKEAKIPCALIQDCGKTEFKKPTHTCCAVGPAEVGKVDKITGHLKLL